MDYTQANGYVTHAGTGHRMAQDTGVVPTEIAAADANAVTWSLMAVQEAGGIAPAAFNPDVPATYKGLLRAIFNIAHPVGCIRETALAGDAGDLNLVYSWAGATWVEDLSGTVRASRSVTEGSPFNVAVGTVIGADETTLAVNQIPPLEYRDWYYPESAGPVSGATSKETMPSGFNGGLGTSATDSDNTTVLYRTPRTEGGSTPVSLIQRSKVVRVWVRTA
jgi:hypothetical protein